jgi:predicted secreted protein
MNLPKLKNYPYEIEQKNCFFQKMKIERRFSLRKLCGGDGDDEWRPTIEI